MEANDAENSNDDFATLDLVYVLGITFTCGGIILVYFLMIIIFLCHHFYFSRCTNKCLACYQNCIR